MHQRLAFSIFSFTIFFNLCSAFVSPSIKTDSFRASVLHSINKNDESDFPRSSDIIVNLRDKALNKAIIEKLLRGYVNEEEESSLVALKLVGKGNIGPVDSSVPCVFLAEVTAQGESKFTQTLPLPLPSSSANNVVKLLSFAYRGHPISKSLCLTLNPLLVNRDGALFDNLPFSKWTIDPLLRNRDAAKNPIKEKYHLGKRDAYNRFMGKDWYGRSLSIGNVAARAKYMLERDEPLQDVAPMTLAQRVLEIEVKEARMALAEAEEQFSILRTKLGVYDLNEMSDEALINNYDLVQTGLQSVQDAKDSLVEREEALSSLIAPDSNLDSNNFLTGILSAIVDSESSDAPYRGAQGYKPVIDSKQEMFDNSVLPYSSPFEMMKEIINEQLNADIIGVFIEDTSLFSGSTVFGGGVVIKRKGRAKTFKLGDEEIEFDDDDDDFGNKGVKKGKVEIIECDFDEAIGLGLACELEVYMTNEEWDRSKITTTAVFKGGETDTVRLPTLQNSIDKFVFARQGDGIMSQNTKIQAPRESDRDISSFFLSNEDRPVFDTNIPVQSLGEYDSLTTEDKAQLLSSLDSFTGSLPRPRVLRDADKKMKKNTSAKKSEQGTTINPLDEMLLPLIDESVRRQVLIRAAEEQGNFEEVIELERQRSRRQIAKENAEIAIEEGKDDLAAMWQNEAEFYGTLRADVTQDEGTYSSYLDRDEWYERTRQKISEKNKKKFGNLLDGLE